MKKNLFITLAIGLVMFSLASCNNDDDVRIIESEIEMEDGKDFMNLARVGGEYKVEIVTESDAVWEASVDKNFGYVAWTDTMGVGSQTITLYTTTNRYDNDRTGNLCITFPGNEESNKVIPLKQLGKISDPENAANLQVGNQVYAVGFGYDTRDLWANPLSVKAEILRTTEMINNAYISQLEKVNLEVETDIVTGSSASELSNELNASAKVSGGGWGFKAEAGASFNKKDFSSNKYEYAVAYINASSVDVGITKSASALRKYYMTPEAYDDINGLNEDGERSDSDCDYPSTESGFDKLINAYGTHLVNKATLGGRVRYAMRMDVSQIKGSYDLNAYAKMSYSGVVDAESSVSDELKESYENNKSNIHTTVSVLGGSKETVSKISQLNKPEDLTTCFDDWMKSLEDEENLALMDFNASDAFIPLYELVNKAKYPERYAKMKEYMKTGRITCIESISMEYECATSTMIEGLPTFDGSSEKNTLIKDVYNQGQWVGRICNEYIPVINKKERVTVVYPVFSNAVKYNMGYFVGDAGHAPARVCWQGDNLTVTECPDDSIGAKMTLYLRGSEVSAKCYDGYVEGTTQDATVAAQGMNGVYNYPIVKIFNRIWMRENYKASKYTNGENIGCKFQGDGTDYWSKDYGYYSQEEAKNSNFAPAPWRVSSKDDFVSIKNVLETNGVAEISTAKAFYPDANGGVLGFHHWHTGYYASGKFHNGGWYGEYGCLKDGNNDDVIEIKADEGMKFLSGYEWSDNQRFTVRLVQDIKQ